MHARRISLSKAIFLVSLAAIPCLGSAQAQPSPQAFVARANEALVEHHPGRAILNLERARLLSPRSRLIADDLAQARLVANLPPIEPQSTGSPSQLLRTRQCGQVALAGLGLAAAALIAVIGKLGRRPFLLIALLGGLVATAGLRAAIRTEPPPNLAVVVAPGLLARVAPSMSARALFAPQEGSVVSVVRFRARFVLISSGGCRGWVPAEDVETILPAT